MIRKQNDLEYLGCRKEKIETASPLINNSALRLYYYYMSERNNIYQRKEIYRKDPPWTEDSILAYNSFTCIKRWLDRTSRWLIDNISNNQSLSYDDRVWRSIIFRLYNKIETAELIELDKTDFWKNIESAFVNLNNCSNDPFTRAYKVITPKYAYRDSSPFGYSNWKASLLWYIYKLCGAKYNDQGTLILNGIKGLEKDALSSLKWLKGNIRGVGNFIAYQIFIDLTYISEYPISEEEFVVSGPGCHAGLCFLFDDFDGMSDEEALFWLRNNLEELFKGISNKYSTEKFLGYLDEKDRRFTVMDIENSMCEYSKYIYLKNGVHKKKRKYDPYKTRK